MGAEVSTLTNTINSTKNYHIFGHFLEILPNVLVDIVRDYLTASDKWVLKWDQKSICIKNSQQIERYLCEFYEQDTEKYIYNMLLSVSDVFFNPSELFVKAAQRHDVSLVNYLLDNNEGYFCGRTLWKALKELTSCEYVDTSKRLLSLIRKDGKTFSIYLEIDMCEFFLRISVNNNRVLIEESLKVSKNRYIFNTCEEDCLKYVMKGKIVGGTLDNKECSDLCSVYGTIRNIDDYTILTALLIKESRYFDITFTTVKLSDHVLKLLFLCFSKESLESKDYLDNIEQHLQKELSLRVLHLCTLCSVLPHMKCPYLLKWVIDELVLSITINNSWDQVNHIKNALRSSFIHDDKEEFKMIYESTSRVVIHNSLAEVNLDWIKFLRDSKMMGFIPQSGICSVFAVSDIGSLEILEQEFPKFYDNFDESTKVILFTAVIPTGKFFMFRHLHEKWRNDISDDMWMDIKGTVEYHIETCGVKAMRNYINLYGPCEES